MKDQFADYAEEPQAAKESPITEDGSPEGQGDSIHIPKEVLQGTQFKEGDELVLKVVAADDEGLEVEYAKAPEKEGGGEESSANEEIDQMGSNHMGGGY